MPDLIAIGQGFSALKALTDLGKAMIDTRDAAVFRDKQIEFQSRIIEVQNTLFELQRERTDLISRIAELEREVTSLKAWDAEKERYKLVEVHPGAYAYVIKAECQDDSPEHLLCPTCFERGKKTILQFRFNTAGEHRECPSCKTTIRIAPASWAPTGQRRW